MVKERLSLDFTSCYKKSVDEIVDKKWNNNRHRNHIPKSLANFRNYPCPLFLALYMM